MHTPSHLCVQLKCSHTRSHLIETNECRPIAGRPGWMQSVPIDGDVAFRWIVQVVEPRQIKRHGKIHQMSTRQFSNTNFFEVLQCGGRERPGSLIILSGFPRVFN